MTDRLRLAVFWMFVAGCLAGTGAYVWMRATKPATVDAMAIIDLSSAAAASTIDAVRAAPHLSFLSARDGQFGHLSLTPLDALAGPPVVSSQECERSYLSREFGLCLELNRNSVEPRAFARILDRRLHTLASFPLSGLPIRARVSPDQRYAASTVFVSGENYASDFTTQTVLYDLATRQRIAELEQFRVVRDGRTIRDVDFNFWGVTFFNDGNRFYATLGTGGKRLLVRGDIARRELQVVGDDVECPSLSPDERHIVFKRHRAQATGWQLWAMDLQSRETWPITDDTQDLDDQVEWLDNHHVIYSRVSGDGTLANRLALWVSTIDRAAGFDQTLFLRAASSPSIVR